MAGSPGPLRYRLWVGGLPKDITEDQIKRPFEKYGEVVDVQIRSSSRDTFAFVQLGSRQGFDDALDNMRDTTILGARVKIAAATADAKATTRRQPDDRRNDDGRNDDRRYDDRRGDDRDLVRRDERRDERRDDRWEGRSADRGRGDESGRDAWQRGRSPERQDQWRGDRGGYGRNEGDHRSEPRGGYGRNDNRNDGGGRYDDRSDGRGPDRRDRLSPPPNRRSPPRDRSRSRGGGYPSDRMAGKVPVGRHKITIEGIPDDMSWVELKDVGRDYGQSLTFSRTYRYRDQNYGMLEYSDSADAETAIRELDRRRVQGSNQRLRCYPGPGPGGDKR